MDDVTEITQLILREREGRDRGWWAQMHECFHEDSIVNISWFQGSGAGFIEGSAKMAARGITSIHRLSPPVVHLKGNRAIVEVPAAIEMRRILNGVEADIVTYARLIFRVEKRAGDWKIFSFGSIYERDTLTPSIPGTTLNIDPEAFSRFRPSYRVISYNLSLTGVEIPNDLYGDDRPEEVAAFYRSLFEWAGIPAKA